MPRLRIPAYGKRLLDERRAGRHPLEVNLVYGDKGFDVAEPKLWIRPEEYTPGKFDFHMLAGLRVTIHDQLAGGWEVDETTSPPTWGKFYDLLGEVAAAPAVVLVCWPRGVQPRNTWAQAMAFVSRWRGPAGVQWPRWWSDDIDRQQSALMAPYTAWLTKLNQQLAARERDAA